MKIYGDYLKRSQIVEDISNMVVTCTGMDKPITFSIEGEWGRGKTWIIEKVVASLSGIDLSQEKSTCDKKDKQCLVFMYNAWEKDYYDEPLISILITLVNQLNDQLKLKNLLEGELVALYEASKDFLEIALRTISKRVIGIDVVDIGKKGIQIVKKAKEASKLEIKTECTTGNVEKDIDMVVSILNKLSQYIPLVFIVDELDRCLPEHAIKTLERLHHIFGKVNSSVTIVSVNEAQLKKTVEKMFGDKIPFESYLRKFVDFRIALDTGSADNVELLVKLNDFFEYFGEEGDTKFHDEVIVNLCDKMTAREFEKVCNNAMVCHKLVDRDTGHFSRDYAIAELLLFACKIAVEKEGFGPNIMPTNGNIPKTELGSYLKDLFKKIPRRSLYRMTNSFDMVHYICMKALMKSNEISQEYPVEISTEMMEVYNFYDEYIRLYRLIK